MAKCIVCIFGSLLFLLASCGKEQVQIPVNKNKQEDLREDFMELNRQFVELEDQEINRYIDSAKLEMKKIHHGNQH